MAWSIATISKHAGRMVRSAPLLTALAVLAGCAGGEPPGWTFAPLEPTPAGAPETPAGSPAAPSPGGPATPAASPDGDGVAFDTVTPPDDPLTFVPNAFTAGPGVQVTRQLSERQSATTQHSLLRGT